jgi:putative flippase GtrA|tara:strand:- start:1556 stop:1954 length:399 start_codon:yes stop_codon:yes gene_type:complete
VLAKQIKRFLIVGFTTVVIDFTAYRLLLYLDSPTAIAKGLGFVAGTIFAYFANKLWTFNRAKGGTNVFSMFIALYITTLAVNVGVNSGVIQILGEEEIFMTLAFFMATGTSATLNFIGMQMIVFKRKQPIDS